MHEPETLPELIQKGASGAERPFLTLLERRGAAREVGTQALFESALLAAAGLRAEGLQPGDRLLLLLPNGLPFVETLFGALLAGIVPVIYPPPHTARVLERYVAQLGRILVQSRAWGAVLDADALEAARGLPLGGLRLIGPPAGNRPLPQLHRARPGEPALVQYSSGSTGEPKGAVLSHEAILANGRAIGRAIHTHPDEVILSWLPMCHDMGLFGGLIFAWLHRWRSVQLQPHHFLIDPAAWLQGISRHRATITTAPNFAYSLCVHGIEAEELAGVDLGSLRLAFNGAEPVSRRSTEAFAERFARWGLRREALFPVYGMAENTLAVAFPPVGRGPVFDRIARAPLEEQARAVPARPDEPDVKEVANVGRPLEGVEICVLDEKDEPLPERVEGQIGIRGSSLSSGYLNNPEATARAMHRGWLRTGDRGYLAAGELYVTGRQSDLIIRAGRNLHPQDLEAAAAELQGVRRGCVVAIGRRAQDDSTDEVWLLAETRLPASAGAELEALGQRIREALVEALGIVPERVILLEPRALPKTTSGKLQRRLTLRLLESGELRPLWGGLP
jgi:acyl-CoA synthetase (AMP-forming)/AMP-acid ligase II